MASGDLAYRLRGINPTVKRKYVALFNSNENKERAQQVLDDLMIRFKFYGAKPTNDPIQLAKNAAYREVIEYILTMASRISDDSLEQIEKFING
jgi:hypothetical protein